MQHLCKACCCMVQVHVASAAGQQPAVTLRSWQQHVEVQAAAATAAARTAASPPAQPRPLKRLRKVADAAEAGRGDAEAGADGVGDGTTSAPGAPSLTASLRSTVEHNMQQQQGGDTAEAASASADAQPHPADKQADAGLQPLPGLPLQATAQLQDQVCSFMYVSSADHMAGKRSALPVGFHPAGY
jgi:hypothetical protein